MKTIKIDKAGFYLNEVIELDQNFFDWPWTKDQWESLDFDHNGLWVLRESDEIIGFCLFQTLKGDEVCHLYKILVKPDRLRLGGASMLLNSSLEHLVARGFRSVYLEVSTKNLAAISFYKKFGFKELRKIPHFYNNGDDAQCLSFDLSTFL